MRFLSNSAWCAGVQGDGGHVSVIRQFGPSAHAAVPMDDHRVLCQIYAPMVDHPQFVALNLDGSYTVLLDEGIASTPAGGGGHWSVSTAMQIWMDGRVLHNRVQGQPHPIDFTADGSLALCREWDFGGLFWLNLINGERTDLEPRGVFAEDARCAYDHGATWRVGQGAGCLRANAHGLPPTENPIRGQDGCYFAVVCFLDGKPWRANLNGGRIIVYPAGETQGYAIPVGFDTGYGLDLRPVPFAPTQLQLIYAASAGEQLPSLIHTVVDTSRPRVSLL